MQTENQIKYVKENYPTIGLKKCAENLGITRHKIQTIINKLGLRLTKDTKRNLMREWVDKNARRRIDPEQFFAIQTPEIAYILGLIWADGYVLFKEKRNIINFSIKLEDFLEIKHIFLKTGEWKETRFTPTGCKTQGKLEISSKEIAMFLYENDYKSKSVTSACKILSKIPDHLKHYWFRGLVDGDGCFYITKDRMRSRLEICSSYRQDWKYMEDILNQLGVDYKINRRETATGNSSNISVFKRSHIIKFGSFIYKDYKTDGIGFTRKYKKYTEIVSRERELNGD